MEQAIGVSIDVAPQEKLCPIAQNIVQSRKSQAWKLQLAEMQMKLCLHKSM
jgi:hypothetical protein